jgi:hypothetical protein
VNGAVIAALMMVISIVTQRRNKHRRKLKFGMEWIVLKMKQTQYVLESIGAEKLNHKLHGVRIYDYCKNCRFT